METNNKSLYETPLTNVVEVNAEGVICASGGMQNYNWNEYEE